MAKHKNIFLIGPMGAGKTTIGRQLARKLNREFYDSDCIIEQRTGADIPLIFELEGEDGFRKREQAIIDEYTRKNNIVLATGGGAILHRDNRENLINRGVVFYLCSSLESLLERTHKDKNRPLLHGQPDQENVLKTLLEERDPLYRNIADYTVDTSNTSIQTVIQAIIGNLDNG